MTNLRPIFENIFATIAPRLFVPLPTKRCFYCGGKVDECHHAQVPEDDPRKELKGNDHDPDGPLSPMLQRLG
jgi:hypothetical protein